ncbi:MAG TPA: type II secretion system protein N [Steroidobacteraceae bacterium]|nr:type II secretion system protein N [Steroidobacteraceae bacterium]
MPASHSARRDINPRPARRWPLILLALIVLAAAVVYLLPASMVSRFLPPQIHAEDFSGSLLHGAAGRIVVNTRDAGAIEWQIHPLALLRLAVVADVHWVKVGFVIDGTAEIGTGGITGHGIKGGGPIEDLRDLGLAAGWRGTANLTLTQIKSDFRNLETAVGKIEVAGISSTSIAQGSDLGSYVLTLAPGGIAADGTITATVNDTGGPVEAQAQIRFSPAVRTGMLSGTLKERPEAAPALRVQLSNLAQLRPRDSYGRFPVDLEFTF